MKPFFVKYKIHSMLPLKLVQGSQKVLRPPPPRLQRGVGGGGGLTTSNLAVRVKMKYFF